MIQTPAQNTSFTWQDGLKVVLAVMAFGIGWFADNQATVIAYAALFIVWLVSLAAKQNKELAWLQGKGPLTVLVFFIAFIVSYLFQPFTLPVLPAWTGDAGTYVPIFSAWIGVVCSIVGNAVVFSMSVYNVLLAKVLEKIPQFFFIQIDEL